MLLQGQVFCRDDAGRVFYFSPQQKQYPCCYFRHFFEFVLSMLGDHGVEPVLD